METEILTIYCLCDELLKAFGHHDHPQCVMNNAEVMTVAIVAAMNFGGNFALARAWLHTPTGYQLCWAKADTVGD